MSFFSFDSFIILCAIFSVNNHFYPIVRDRRTKHGPISALRRHNQSVRNKLTLARVTFLPDQRSTLVDSTETVLGALGYVDELMATSPERILEISGQMQLQIESFTISLERLNRLLAAQAAGIMR